MDFEESAEVNEFIEGLKGFIETEAGPKNREWLKSKTTNRDFFRAIGKGGYLGFLKDDAGFSPIPWLQNINYYSAMAQINGGAAIASFAHSQLANQALFYYGSDEQKEDYLSRGISGERTYAFANTEPGTGSDAAGISLRAVQDGQDFIVNGTKTYITNGDIANDIIFTVITDPEVEKRHRRISMLIAPGDAEGLSRKRLDKLGWAISHLSTLSFKDVRVPAENLIGERGRGFYQTMNVFNSSRIGLAALAFGTALGAFRGAYERATQRNIFGKPLIEFDGKRNEMADRIVQLEAAWLLIQKAAYLKDTGQDFLHSASLAKLFATEAGLEISQWSSILFGASGALSTNKMSQYPLDAKVALIGEGAPEIQKKIIMENIDKILDGFV